MGTYVKAHHIRRGTFVAGLAVAAAVFFVVGAFIRLLIGPVSLGPFSDRISAAMAEALPGLIVRYDQAALEWSWEDNRVSVVVLGARVFDTDGRIVAQAPKAELALAALPLLSGDVELRRIALVGVQLTLVRTAEGELRLGVEKGHGNSDILKRITDAINAKSSSKSTLQTFAVRNARIAFLDEKTGLFLVAPKANVQVHAVGDGLIASVKADIEVTGHPAQVDMEVNLPSGDKPVTGELSLNGLSLDALGSNGHAFETLKGIKLVTDLSASFALTPDNKLQSLDFGIDAKGALAIRGLIHGPMHVKQIKAVGKFDAPSNRVLIDDMQLSSDGASAHGNGRIDFARDADGKLARVGADLAIDKIAVNMPGIFLQPFKLSTASLRASYDATLDQITVEHLNIAGGPFTLTAAGKVTRAGDASPAIDATATIAPLGVRELLVYWPRAVASGAWEWANTNMKAGRVGPLTAQVHIPVGAIDAPIMPEQAVNVTMPLTDVTMSYFHKLTPMTNVAGVITLTGDTFSADVKSGRIGSLILSGGKVVIPELHADNNIAEIDAHGVGPLPDILTLIDMDPLHYATRFHINPKTTTGTAGLDIAFKVPTRNDASDDDIKIGIKSSMKNLAVSITDKLRITQGDVDLTIDNDHLTAVGNVMLLGSRMALNWTEGFKAGKDGLSSHILVRGPLTDAAREALGFHSGDYLKGPVNISAVLDGAHGQLRKAQMTMDLSTAAVGVDYLGIGKPVGTPGTALVSATFIGDTVIQAETMRITGGGIDATGGASFNKDGDLTSVFFPTVHAGPTNDFSFIYTRMANGGTDISVRGRTLDGTKIGRKGANDVTTPNQPGAPQEEDNTPFHISAKVDHLALRNNVTISPFTLDITGYGDRPQTLALDGTLGKSGKLSGSIVAGDGGRKIVLTTDDTGLLLQGLFGFTSMKGGNLNVAAVLPGRADVGHRPAAGGADFSGTATITDFHVVNQPFLTRLFSAGSLTGLANLMGNRGIEFDKATIPFASRNGIINIRDARAAGGATGMTADGYYDRPNNKLALKGSLVPIFGINSILGAIPVLGNLLVSKKGEGVFGMTYTAQGAADEPNISVNPLSILTPGIFRRIFEGRVPESAQSSQLPQAQTQTQPASPPAAPTKSKDDD